MSVIRVNKNHDYTVISNHHLRDRNLTLKAKGLLTQMLALPEEWDYTVKGLAAINKECESAIETALRELRKEGYLIVTKKNPDETASGRFEYVYDVYEVPGGGQEGEKQGVEKQGVEILPVENQAQLNKDNQDTKQSNTEDINNKYKAQIRQIVELLNEVAGMRYKATTRETSKLIKARLAEGYTVEDFEKVIRSKVAEWRGTDMEKYIRPVTLFGSKFEGYLNAGSFRGRGANGIKLDGRAEDELDGIL